MRVYTAHFIVTHVDKGGVEYDPCQGGEEDGFRIGTMAEQSPLLDTASLGGDSSDARRDTSKKVIQHAAQAV